MSPFAPFAPEQKLVLDLRDRKAIPLSITVPRGARVELGGHVAAGKRRTFFAFVDGRTVARQTARDKWRLAFDTRDITRDSDTLVVSFADGNGLPKEFVRIGLRVIQTNPFRLVATPRPTAGAVDCRVEGAIPGEPIKVRFLKDGHTGRSLDPSPEWTFRGLDATPGPHTIAAEVEMANGLRIPVPAARIDVPSLLDLVPARPGKLTITRANFREAYGGVARPVASFSGTPIRLVMDGKPRGTIAADGTWSIPVDGLPEGSHRVVALYRGADGAEIASTPLVLEAVHAPDYLAFRARERVLDSAKTDLPLLLRAHRLTWGVRLPAEENVTFVYRDGKIARKERRDGTEPMFGQENWSLFSRVVRDRSLFKLPDLTGRLDDKEVAAVNRLVRPYDALVDYLNVVLAAKGDGLPLPITGLPSVVEAEALRRRTALEEAPARLAAAQRAEAELEKALAGTGIDLDGGFARVAKRKAMVEGPRRAVYEWQADLMRRLKPMEKDAPDAWPLDSRPKLFTFFWNVTGDSIRDHLPIVLKEKGFLLTASGLTPQQEAALLLAREKLNAAFKEIEPAREVQVELEELDDELEPLILELERLEDLDRKEKTKASEARVANYEKSLETRLGPKYEKFEELRDEYAEILAKAYTEFAEAERLFGLVVSGVFPRPEIQNLRG